MHTSLVALPAVALLHTAALWPSAAVMRALVMVNLVVALGCLAAAVAVQRGDVLLAGLAALGIQYLLVTVSRHGVRWLNQPGDALALALALFSLTVLGGFHLLRNIANRRPNQLIRRALIDLAREFRGEYLPEYPRVLFRDRQRQVTLTPEAIDRQHHQLYLDLAAPWPDRAMRLEVKPASTLHRLKDLLGMQDVPLGDTHFDRALKITANDTDQCVQVLQANLRDELRSLLEDQHDFCLSIVGGRFLVRIGTEIYQRSLTEAAHRACECTGPPAITMKPACWTAFTSSPIRRTAGSHAPRSRSMSPGTWTKNPRGRSARSAAA